MTSGEVTAAIRSLIGSGMSIRDAAERLGLHEKAVAAALVIGEPAHVGMRGEQCQCTPAARDAITRGCAAECWCHGAPHAECPNAKPCLGRCGRLTTAGETHACGYCARLRGRSSLGSGGAMSAKRVPRSRLTVLAALSLLTSACPAIADPISPTLEFSTMRLEVTWTDAAGIRAVRERYQGPVGDIRSSASIGTTERSRGFALLVRRDGELICRVYVQRPEAVDDDSTKTLGHELLHCLLGDYHR